MDYEQWKPLGRGDPLKNDPTYDYVPPVLERVHYWIDPALRKPDPEIMGENNHQKTEILVLGVTSKKPSGSPSITDRRDNYDPFLKFVEGPKFSRPHYTLPASYYPSPFYANKNKLPERPGFSSKGEQRVPYTMLVPPPVHKKSESAQFQKPHHDVTPIATTLSTISPFGHSTPGVVVQQSNLVYHSSSLSHHDWKDKNHHHFATQAESSSHVTWKTPQPNKTYEDSESDSKKNEMNYVTMPPVVSHVMHKGEVTDDTMDIASTYVNIGKPEAQVHPPMGVDISTIQIPSPSMTIRQPPMVMNPSSHLLMGHPLKHSKPLPIHSMDTMQTMQPPPVESTFGNIMNAVQTLLQKEVTPSESFPVTNSIDDYTASEIRLTPTAVPATTSPTTTTTTTKLTTDPLFKHYKQPEAPLRGPMYLIIQGHSKVKTYGPSKQMNGIPIQETNEVLTADEYSNVKHLHGYKKEVNEERHQRESRSGDLQTLTHVVQTGLGAINFDMEENRRMDQDVQETELGVKYEVGSKREATSEKYYKGIVEAGKIGRKLDATKER